MPAVRDRSVRGCAARAHARRATRPRPSARWSSPPCTRRSARRSATRSSASPARRALDAVASHGVTLAHDGDAHHTLQLGDAFRIRERVARDGASTTSAPPTRPRAAPARRWSRSSTRCCSARTRPCVALNLGGIANLTVLPQTASRSTRARRTCRSTPTSRCARAARNATTATARSRAPGTPDAALLASMLDDPYFARAAAEVDRPRTLRRAVRRRVARASSTRSPFADAVATLTALTRAHRRRRAVRAAAPHARLLIVERRRRAQPGADRRRFAPRCPASTCDRPTRSASTPTRRRRSRSPCSATRRCASRAAGLPASPARRAARARRDRAVRPRRAARARLRREPDSRRRDRGGRGERYAQS